ncbi:hypothetical protein D3C87_1307830 [compost metagenome]
MRALEVGVEVHGHEHLLPLVGEHAGQEVHLDVLALAGTFAPVQGGQHAVDDVHRADLVREAGTHGHGRSVAAPGGGGQPGQALDQHVLAGPLQVGAAVAIAGARAIDDARIDFLEGLVAEAQARQHAGTEVLDQHIGALDQFVDHFARAFGLEVQGQGALVAVPGQEVGAFAAAQPAVVERQGTEQVALARTFHLDDGGAQVGQQLRGERALKKMAEVEDGDVL